MQRFSYERNIFAALYIRPWVEHYRNDRFLCRVPVPVRAMVYCEGVRQSAEKVWNKMFELYQRERVQVERERLLIGLTCSRDTFTLKK